MVTWTTFVFTRRVAFHWTMLQKLLNLWLLMLVQSYKFPEPAVATFLYGAAHHEGRSLDSIRRELTLLQVELHGDRWSEIRTLRLTPDNGPPRALQRKGVLVIGATRWVDNYNIPIFSNDITMVRKISRRLSGRGGGLASVQSMALAHGNEVIELACNLLEPSRIGGDKVQLHVERLAKEEPMEVGKGLYNDLSQDSYR